MNKNQLIDTMAEQNNISKKDAKELFENVIELISKSLEENKEFTIPGFGKFEIKHSEARIGRNPRTGEDIQIAAKNSIKFKAAKALNDRYNG